MDDALRRAFLRAHRICDLWNEVTDVLESGPAWVIAHWQTSA